MEQQDQQMFAQFATLRSRICHEANVAAARFYLDMEDRIANWVQSYTTSEPHHLWDVFSGDTRTRLVKELTTYLTDQVQREFHAWVCSALQLLLCERLQTIVRSASRQTEQLLWQDTRNAENGREDRDAIVQDAVVRIVTAVERYERFVWHPLVLIARLLEMASVQAPLNRCASREKIRDAVAWAYRRELMETLYQRVSAIVGIVDVDICKVQEKLSSALCVERQCILDRAQTSIAKEQPGREQVAGEVPVLIALEDELHEIEYELTHLINTRQ